MVDGFDVFGLINIGMSESILKKVVGIDKFFDKQEVEVSVWVFVVFIDQLRWQFV